MRRFILALLVVFVLVVNVSCQESFEGSRGFEVHVIDVGQGDSILLKSPDGKCALIDTGSFGSYDELKAYLLYEGIDGFDKVIATHPDSDHIGSMAELINDFDIEEFYMPDKEHSTKSYNLMVEALDSNDVTVINSFAGDEFSLSDEVRGYFLSPYDRVYDENNLYSLVLYLEHGSNGFLFMGDAERPNEFDILRDFPLLKADFIKLGHHGSNSSSSREFIQSFDPFIAALSVGKGNSFGHPHKEVVEILEDEGVKLYRTDEQGSLVFVSDGESIFCNQKSSGSYDEGRDD